MYVDFRDEARRKRLERWTRNSWFLLHDNAPAHRLFVVKQCLAKRKLTALEHPPRFPDLSLPHFFLFPPLKEVLKGQRFASAAEGAAKTTRALIRASENDFQKCFQKLYKHGENVG
jgi:hypothetical protein